MAIYEGLQSILNAALGEYHSKGFSLVEQGDHTLSLFYKDERIGYFSQIGMTIMALHKACEDYLRNKIL